MAVRTYLRGRDLIDALIGPLGLGGRPVKGITIRADYGGVVEIDVTEVVRVPEGETPAGLAGAIAEPLGRARKDDD